MSKHEPRLLAFGNGGHSIEYTGRCHLSGYCRPDNIKITPDLEGIPVLDKRPAIETEAGYSWVFRGPLVDVELADDEIDSLPAPSPIFASAMTGNEFGALLALHVTHDSAAGPGPLDSVSVSRYMRGWIERGARYGVVRNGAIEWAN